MPVFLTELHAHTAETSRCAHNSAKTLVDAYLAKDFQAVVITDHLSESTFEAKDALDAPWDEKVDIFLKGYRAAKAYAGDRLHILLGMELRFAEKGNINDYLVYGVTEDFLRKSGDLLKMRLASFSRLAQKNGLLVVQAHPFRNDMKIVNPAFLDGVEVFNACVRHNSRNEIAHQWATLHNLLGTSGSDYHQTGDEGRGGIQTETPIKNNDDLLNILKSGAFTRIETE